MKFTGFWIWGFAGVQVQLEQWLQWSVSDLLFIAALVKTETEFKGYP